MPARAHDRQRPDRIAQWALAAAVTGATLAACTSGGPSSVASRPTTPPSSFSLSLPTPHSAGPPTPTSTGGVAAATTPQAAADQWLIAYHSLSWSDGTPTAWITQVKPYVTPSLDAADQQDSDQGGGADWTDFVTNQCTSTVTDVGAVIPPEAPGTATAVNVQVTGTVQTSCAAGNPNTPTESASATLVVVPGPDGSWLVNQRLF